MTDALILETVTSFIQELTEWTVDNCKPKHDGRPDPIMGDFFCAVHMNEYQTRSKIVSGELEEIWGFAVTVTKRLSAVPIDRVTDSIYLNNVRGISTLINKIIIKLDSSKDRFLNTINDAYEYTDEDIADLLRSYQFMTPYRFMYRSPKPVLNDEEWTHGTHGDPSRDNRDGLNTMSMTAFFGGLTTQVLYAEEEC